QASSDDSTRVTEVGSLPTSRDGAPFLFTETRVCDASVALHGRLREERRRACHLWQSKRVGSCEPSLRHVCHKRPLSAPHPFARAGFPLLPLPADHARGRTRSTMAGFTSALPAAE